MDAHATSGEFLAHFDRPKTVDCPDFDWDESAGGAVAFDSSVACDAPFTDSLEARSPRRPGPQPPATAGEPPAATISAWCVLQWAAAIVVLAIAANVPIEFGSLVAAEHALNVAARAGAMEASLPKATYESVSAVIERRLAATYPQLNGKLQLTLLVNGTPVVQHFRPVAGDRLSVTISAPTSSLISGCLRTLSPGRRESLTSAHAESQAPGRKLPPGRS